MNAYAFLLMLAVFGAVAYWYVLNVETKGDGERGPLALKPDVDSPVETLHRKLHDLRRRGHHARLDRIRAQATPETPRRAQQGAEKRRARQQARALDADAAALERSRKQFSDPRTGEVRGHFETAEKPRPRSPYTPERGAEADVETRAGAAREKLRTARLQGPGRPRPAGPDRPRRYRLKDDPPRH